MKTSSIIQPGIPIILVHGTEDGTNPITRVREDILLGTKGLIKLVELEDNHSIKSATVELIEGLISELIVLKDKVEDIKKQEEATQPPTKKPAPAVARNALFSELLNKNKK